MKEIKTFLRVFAQWTVIGSLSKVLFLFIYRSLIPSLDIGDCLSVLWHGLLLDVAIAGYLTILPGLMLILSLWYSGKVLRWIWNGYFALTAFISVFAYVSNLGLYAYWGFPLDSTPLLYIRTSPSAALASMTAWQLVVIPIVILLLSVVVYKIMPRMRECVVSGTQLVKRRGWARKAGVATVLLLATAALIIPIRGGFGTGTNHTGSVYFSSDIRLNHAAVNPIFCFVESATHQEEIATRYRFMDGGEADRIFATMTHTALRPDAVRHDYNVVLICLESFSKYIMTEAGHVKGVTPYLERYAREGWYFTDIYASSFRTDRGLVSVLSGLPAQPTMTIMDVPRISTTLPSIARTLGSDGYDTHFYYGGDTNFSNMKSYIMGTGFQKVTAQYEFSAELSTGKWGVADGPVYDRMMEDIKREAAGGKPFFKTFMTSSSHEPFDVPNYKKLTSPELNAFSYADHCLGLFIEELKTLPCWKNTLVVIVPDHLGAYPLQVDNYQRWRYEIPLVMTGGVIENPRKIATTGSQTDICATVLAMLGREHKEFIYSKDLLDDKAPHFAFFSFPDAMGMAADGNYMYFDNTSNSIIVSEGIAADTLLPMAKAYLQKLYDDLGSR